MVGGSAVGTGPQKGCLVPHRGGTTAERHERELKHLRILCTRFSEARRESFCPLDTDLSWMSGSPSTRNHRREARTRAEAPKNFMHALLRSPPGDLFPPCHLLITNICFSIPDTPPPFAT